MTSPAVGAAAKAVGGKVPRGTRAARKKAAAAANPPVTPAAPTAPAPTPNPTPAPQPAPPVAKTPPPSLPKISVPSPVSSGAGFLLALAFWTWVALPFFKDGLPGVKNMLKAKFTNKAPDGSWLP